MADEFVKGLGVATAGGLAWMVLSGWYTTPGFEDTQLIGEPPTAPDIYGELALLSREAVFWFTVLGVLAFWVLIPALNQYRAARAGEEEQ